MALYSLKFNEGLFVKERYDFVLDFLRNVANISTFNNLLVLDAGCGERGTLGRFLKEKGAQVIFVDSAPQKMANLPAQCEYKVCANATRLPLKGNKFGIILSLDLLEHLPEIKRIALIEEIARVLKINGYVLLTYSSFSSNSRAVRILFETQFKLPGINLPAWYLEHNANKPPDIHEVEDCFKKSGIGILRIQAYQGVLNIVLVGMFYSVSSKVPIPACANNLLYVIVRLFDLPPKVSFFVGGYKK